MNPLVRASLLALISALPAAAAEVPRVALTPNSPVTRIAIVGDLHGSGARKIAPELARLWRERSIDAVILTGDNFEGCGATGLGDPEWAQYTALTAAGVPIFPVLGNHDYGNPKIRWGRVKTCGEPDPQSQIAHSKRVATWRFPARQYIINTPHADFIMSDSSPVSVAADRPLFGSETAAGVTKFVRSALASSRVEWKIVVGHHNIDQSGMKRARAKGTRERMSEFGRILRASGASLYISGHQHQIELLAATRQAPMQLISGAVKRPKKRAHLTPKEAHSVFAGTVDENSAAFAILEVTQRELRVSFHEMGRRTPLHQSVARSVNGNVIVTELSPGGCGAAARDRTAAGTVHGDHRAAHHRTE